MVTPAYLGLHHWQDGAVLVVPGAFNSLECPILLLLRTSACTSWGLGANTSEAAWPAWSSQAMQAVSTEVGLLDGRAQFTSPRAIRADACAPATALIEELRRRAITRTSIVSAPKWFRCFNLKLHPLQTNTISQTTTSGGFANPTPHFKRRILPRVCSMEASASLGGASHSTAMCWAASEGNLEAMRRLREEHGADVNSADYDKRTPLHIAVSDEQLEMVDYLLQCGANAEALDRWGRSPIDCAVESKNVAILRLLEREHYPVHSRKLSLFEGNVTTTEGMRRSRSSPDVAAFFRAVQEGNTENVKRSWLGGMGVNVTDELGRTSLHVAVENGQLGVIELLLSAGVNTNVVDARGRSPISIALEKQQFAIAEMLRVHQKKKLVSRQAKGSEDEHNTALAFRATKQGDMEKLKQLVPELCRGTPADRQVLGRLWSQRQLVGSVGVLAAVGCGGLRPQ
ncbi:hypothetical protein ON010_g14867 [Phytophthora cinnamomi]|nr:hypothetical protein ON010_g14867 [Phytophthora cinnamomi]